jgi:hypothetical protein
MKKSLIGACVITLIISVAGTLLVCDHLFGLFGRSSSSNKVIINELPSKVLNEEREVIVHLPESYDRDTERRYPVIYVLDGSSQDGHTAYSAALMARIGVMPELIVVGLPNVSGEGRQRDYTPPFMVQDLEKPGSPRGEADRFLSFLRTELIPKIESDYRTTPFRMLAGYSRGGLLVAYSLLADSQLFDARFAHSPALWREDTIMAAKLSEFLSANTNLKTFLYMSMGLAEDEEMITAYRKTVSVIAQHASSGLRWQADFIPGADHGNNSELATPVGFKALYHDWAAQDALSADGHDADFSFHSAALKADRTSAP